MKILWLSWRDIINPQSGGAEKVAYEITKRLERENHKVTIFTSQFKNGKTAQKQNGINIVRYGNQLTCRFFAFLYYLRNRPFDLVIDEINTIPFFTPLFVPAKKNVILIHQLAKEYWFSLIVWPLSLLGFILEPIWLKLYSKRLTLTVSESTKWNLKNLGFKNVKIISEGIGIKPQLIKQKENIILFIGRLTNPKRPQDAITAFKHVHKLFPAYQLLMIGRGDKKMIRSLKNLIRKMNLANRVQIKNNVDDKEKIRILKRSKIILIPSIREGWGLVATEASAQSCIPIAYNVPGLKDSIKNGQTGILTDTDPLSLALATVRVLSDDKLRINLAKNCFVWTKQFSWENCYQDFKQFIEKMPSDS